MTNRQILILSKDISSSILEATGKLDFKAKFANVYETVKVYGVFSDQNIRDVLQLVIADNTILDNQFEIYIYSVK